MLALGYRFACLLSLALLWCLAASPALAVDLFYDTQITSLNLTGMTSLPVGPDGEPVAMGVRMAAAQDYNSSRSNTTTAIGPPDGGPDDVDPDDLDGKTFPLYGTIDLKLTIDFFDPATNEPLMPSLSEFVEFELDPPTTFLFDKGAPDFGMSRAGGPPKKHTFRGHVTVLKSVEPGTTTLDLLTLSAVEGTDTFNPIATGGVMHSFDVTMDFTGLFQPDNSPTSYPFSVTGLTGTLAEQGGLANRVVPEPATAVTLAIAAVSLVGLRRRLVPPMTQA